MPSSDVLTIFGERDSAMGALALQLRALIRPNAPDAFEQPDAAARLVCYSLGPRLVDTVCVISPQRTWVNLGFYKAIELHDPAGLLVGTGKLHRHVKVRGSTDAESPMLRQLLLDAAELARQRRAAHAPTEPIRRSTNH